VRSVLHLRSKLLQKKKQPNKQRKIVLNASNRKRMHKSKPSAVVKVQTKMKEMLKVGKHINSSLQRQWRYAVNKRSVLSDI